MGNKLVRQLKLNHLRLINAIAENRQLGLAAEAMAISQPAASRMLAEIEGIVDTRLFERNAKGMDPTLIGHAMAQRAHHVLQTLQDMTREVDELQHGKAGSASIGAVTGAAVGFVIPAVRQLKATSPRAEINVNVESSSVLVQDLIDGRNDFVLARLPLESNANDFDVVPARSESVRLVVREDHPLAHAKKVSISELATYEWVLQTHRAPMREAVDNAFLAAGATLPVNTINTTSLLAMIAILVSSSAIAPMASEVFNLLVSTRLQARLRVLPVHEPIVMSPYYLLTMKGRRLSPIADRLKALVIEELRQTKE